MVVQTWAFVTFNKVCTEQYFLWYLSLLPFVCINNAALQTKSGVIAMIIYGIQLIDIPMWSWHSFQIEHLGLNYFEQMNRLNQAFFLVNCISIAVVLRHHSLTLTKEFEEGENAIKKINVSGEKSKDK